MTIKKRLHISFALILSIILFIVGIFFYTMYNLSKIHLSQIQTYEEIRSVKKIDGYYKDPKLLKKINQLQKEVYQREQKRDEFVNKIKIELVILLFIAIILALIISSKLIKEIETILSKLNNGVLQLLNNDETVIKVDIGKNNELSEITNNLNTFLEKKENIIEAREELLRNISHELKTPITKGKFLLEKLKIQHHPTTLQGIDNVFYDIEQLISKLLQREKLNFAVLHYSQFKITSLILESLSKLSIEDETKIEIDIKDDFKIEGDREYLIIVVKNLIDNGLKYASSYPIIIQAEHNSLYIKTKGEKLSHDLLYYIQPFTREPNQQIGHGLGLNIVSKIVQMHHFKLYYEYQDPYNVFFVAFQK